MSPLSTLARDLVERRLWPVAALLIVALIAVPVMFLRSTPAAIAPAASTPAPSAPATTAPSTPAAGATTTTPADPGADPGVAMTSSPFAAAFGSGLSLPPSMEGLLKSTKGADDRKTVADAPLRDPFAPASAAGASASTATGASGSSAAAAPAAAPAGTTASAPAGAASVSGGSSAVPAGPGAPPAAAQSESAPVTPVAETKPVSSGDSSSSPAGDSTAVFHADVRFGTTEAPPMVSDAKRLTAFPSTYTPVAVFLGVMRGGWGAAFAIRNGSEPKNAPSCRPRRQICTWVILHPGESVTLNSTDPVSGAVTPYTLKLERVRKTVVTPDAAREAARRASLAGRCLLGPLAAYKYDTNTGTLAPRPELKACHYRAPGQATTAAVRVAHVG